MGLFPKLVQDVGLCIGVPQLRPGKVRQGKPVRVRRGSGQAVLRQQRLTAAGCGPRLVLDVELGTNNIGNHDSIQTPFNPSVLQ